MMETERNTQQNSCRILYMGMLGTLSTFPLKLMLDRGVDVVGVVVPSDALPIYERGSGSITAVSPPSFTSLTPANILDLAWHHHIPAYSVTKLNNQQTIETISTLKPDLICVSCFSKRIPPAILTLPHYGCLNLHPSKLPQHRGPYPLFWTFRNGQRETAVTIHQMDEGLDTGDIIAQSPITFPNGISEEKANQLCGELGGKMYLDILQQLTPPFSIHNPHPQPTIGVSYAPTPQPADFAIDSSWSAERAFNFMRGAAHWKRPFTFKTERGVVEMETAVSFTQNDLLSAPLLWQGQTITIQMTPGTLTARLDNNG